MVFCLFQTSSFLHLPITTHVNLLSRIDVISKNTSYPSQEHILHLPFPCGSFCEINCLVV
jgi:hypothetical protein